MTESFDPDQFTYPFQLTKTLRRDPYEEIAPTNPSNSQIGKIIVITGAYGGLGSAAARIWAQAGASVILTGRDPEKLTAATQKARSLSTEPSAKIIDVVVDITQESSISALYTQIQPIFSRPADILLNNAGPQGPIGPSAQIPWSGFSEVIAAHFLGAVLMSRSFINSQPHPEDPAGTIIYVTSNLAGADAPGFAAYSIAKLAGQKYIEFLDLEYKNLRTFTLSPGIAETGMTNEFFRPFAKDSVEMVGCVSLWLCNEGGRADFLRGGLVSVNWDVGEMEVNKEEIVEGKLVKLGWVGARLQRGGHPFGGLPVVDG